MTTLSTFRINQPPGTPYANWDRARRDIDPYSLASEAVECEAYEKSQTSYSWELISLPDGVSVTINNDDQHTCNFQLETRGGYLIRLTVNEGYPSEHATVLYVGIPLEGSSISMPALSETNQDNSQSPYDGYRGTEEKQAALSRYVESRASMNQRVSTISTNTALSTGYNNENRLHYVSGNGVIVTLPEISSTPDLIYKFRAPAGVTFTLQVYDDVSGDDVFVGSFLEEYAVDWKVISVKPGSLIQVESIALPTPGEYGWLITEAQGEIEETVNGYHWFYSSKSPALFAQLSNTIYRESIERYTTNTALSQKAGYLVTNEGATADIEFQLPLVAAAGETDDSTYRFQQRGDYKITIKPGGTDKIRLPNGRLLVGYLKSTSELCYIELNLNDVVDEWQVLVGAGLWEGVTAGDGFYDFGGPLEFVPAAITTGRSVGVHEIGSVFRSGSGGDDPTIFTLPASYRGANFSFVMGGTDKIRVARGSTDVIYVPGATSYTALETDSQNAVLCIIAVGTGGWFVIGGSGTWYDPGTPANKLYLDGTQPPNLSGAGNPVGVTSGIVNQLYWDTTNKMMYVNHDGSTGWYLV
jgi:hypothetical protein